MRVLIVDDEAGTRHGLAEFLETAGYQTITADGFEVAQYLLRALRPDVLITDIRLGEYNGLQLLINAPSVPAIVISGFDDPVLRLDAEQMGATYLTKPVRPAAVLEFLSGQTTTCQDALTNRPAGVGTVAPHQAAASFRSRRPARTSANARIIRIGRSR